MINPKEITFSGLGQEIITVIIEAGIKPYCYKLHLDDDKSITLKDIEDRAKSEFEEFRLLQFSLKDRVPVKFISMANTETTG